jgi:hypothetical protein
VRHGRAILVAAAVSSGASLAVALFSAYRLADAPVRGRAPGPDPIGSLASLAAVVIGVIAFYRLGATVASDAATARPAIVAGALGGGLAGVIGSAAQSFALADYLTAALAGYAVPSAFLTIVFAVYILLASVGTAVIAAAVAYIGWNRARPKSA